MGAGASRPQKELDGALCDRLSNPRARWGHRVPQRLDLAGEETVLDAGCGSGRVTQPLLARLPRGQVIALDVSASMLEPVTDYVRLNIVARKGPTSYTSFRRGRAGDEHG
ncbi:MAG: class I SAM-dependent methyltransferase [Acidimicrobiales bacterium]